MGTFIHPTKADALATVRTLPKDVIDAIPVLMVNRQGKTDNAYMRTENFLGHAEPGTSYQVTMEGFIPSNAEPKPLATPRMPPHVILDGEWNEKVDFSRDDANILGGNGTYFIPDNDDKLIIPIAETTAEHLAFYGSWLVKVGDIVRFETTGNLPVTITSVGEDYPEHYLLKEDKGGGTYLEVHDRPHFHMPIEENTGGYLIVGKEGTDGIKRVSAFQIPFGYGIHMGAWAIHSDAYIIGRHLVIYSATPEFSTVIIRHKSGKLAPIAFAH